MGAPVVRAFLALSGVEVKKAILADIERQLSADTRFSQHLTYPQISWGFALNVKMYPNEPGHFEIQSSERTVKQDDSFDPSKVEPVELSITAEETVAAPYAGKSADQVRRDAKLPVNSPRMAAGPGGTRQIVDAPSLPQKTGDTSVTVGAVETNADKGGRTFGRSVVQKTAAAPEGVSAAPAAGSAPDIERVQEIMAREGIDPGDGPPSE